MAEYNVVLQDGMGREISSTVVDGIKAAKDKARYMLSDVYAANVGTTHSILNTYKAEVQATGRRPVVLWDVFRHAPPDAECCCQKQVCTYDADFGCGGARPRDNA